MKKKNNPARRASEKNNLAPILYEKKFPAQTQIQAPPPPPPEYQMDRALTESSKQLWWVSEIWLLNAVTCNDISVIYVTIHRCAGGLKKKLNLRSGSQRHGHFVGFFNVPVQAPTRVTLFIRLLRETATFSRLLRHAGDTKELFLS